jgi:hypothetical protein
MKVFKKILYLVAMSISIFGGDAAYKAKYNIEQFLNATDRELRVHKK